jgi:hypothetical protein
MTTDSSAVAPASCKYDDSIRAFRTAIMATQNKIDAGASATRALTRVTFMPSIYTARVATSA